MKTTVVIIFIEVVLSMTSYCQEIQFKGRIFDFETNEPLEAVMVYEKTTSNGTISDSLGNFNLQLRKDSTYVLIDYVGYYKLKIINIPTTSEINLEKIILVRDYSRTIFVDYEGRKGKEIKPDLKKHDRIEQEILKRYEFKYDGKIIKPIINDHTMTLNLKISYAL